MLEVLGLWSGEPPGLEPQDPKNIGKMENWETENWKRSFFQTYVILYSSATRIPPGQGIGENGGRDKGHGP